MSLKEGEALALSSLLETEREGAKHIGMIDFMTFKDNRYNVSLSDCIKTIKDIDEEGFILNSGHSYHFYLTRKLLTREEFVTRMEKLKSYGTIGQNWPTLQLNQGFSLLRISRCNGKDTIPYIIPHNTTGF